MYETLVCLGTPKKRIMESKQNVKFNSIPQIKTNYNHMKRILLVSIFVFIVTLTYGQTESPRFSYSTTIGTGLAMSTPSKTPFSWQVLGYYNITPRWAVGAGTGISIYEKPLLPLFANVKFRIIKPVKWTPYIECGAGYSLPLAKKSHGGFYLSPTIGVEYAAFEKARFLFGIGYEWQELERSKSYQDNYFTSEFQEKLSHHSLAFKIGVVF